MSITFAIYKTLSESFDLRALEIPADLCFHQRIEPVKRAGDHDQLARRAALL
jgi:hypothetical protein